MTRFSTSTALKGQSTLNAFITKKKPEKRANEDGYTSDDTAAGEGDEAYDEVTREKSGTSDTVPDKKASPANSHLPPLSDVPSIFNDLVSRIPEIAKVADHTKGRRIRVATMCSGTESPLLALELIQESMQRIFSTKLDFHHVFSCEIEPFKQAFIERNFSPPILFRDVCELGGEEATTAYGSREPVPGDVDLLIAGTSCVDYSTLNNEKKDIDSNGESGRTFRGMLSWVDKHRPPLVILENVCGAPWNKVVSHFGNIQYSAAYFRVDTKNFYIPHTRTRVYLLAVHQENSKIPDSWRTLVNRLERPASTTLDSWMLPTDDQRIHQARQKLVRESFGALDRRTGRTDWGRCESRHQRARLEEGLGPKRPLTSWEEGGFCKLPDFAWGDWGVVQVERVWDLMDISLLRKAKQGVDPSFKTEVWNLSQNVDREIGSKRLGVCPCLTPSMIPYITNRGGPIVGIEALSMQGLPVNKLLLTRESEDQLADLAGNAMSTTVIGACMLAALVVGRDLLKRGHDKDTYEEKAGVIEAESVQNHVMDVDPVHTNVEASIREESLIEHPLNLSSTMEASLSKLIEEAQASVRLCECEGRTDITYRVLNRCKDCGTTSCEKCGGRPEHAYRPIVFSKHPRIQPQLFARKLKATLPMCISLCGFTDDLLSCLRARHATDIPEKKWNAWRSALMRVVEFEHRFVELKRQEIWIATFTSPWSTLELQLHPQQPEWRLFAHADKKEPANSEIRSILELPVARMRCKSGLLDGCWEIALPRPSQVKVSIRGTGEKVPAWQARLGLQGVYKDQTVFSKLVISVPEDAAGSFDRNISGTYALLDKCGTATNALHRKEGDHGHMQPPLFLFLDPTRCGTTDRDAFVFSINTRRYQFGETRPLICKLDSKWRQADVGEEGRPVTCHIPCIWVKSDMIKMQSSKGREASFATPSTSFVVSMSTDDCISAKALLVCKVPLKDQTDAVWPRGKWVEVDKVHERVTFRALSWLIERIVHENEQFNQWLEVTVPNNSITHKCGRCAPAPPGILWIRNENGKVRAVEDALQAGVYERDLKNRPAVFVTQLRLDEGTRVGVVRIGVNFQSLIHRAYSRLPTLDRAANPTFSWYLNTNFTDYPKLNLPKFILTSNRKDTKVDQPEHFKIPLRPEQLRSLSWMLRQESLDAKPFIEEEIAEAVLGPLNWRAQGRAQRPVFVRGGVLADEVGYGKTAITLGLIDSGAKCIRQEPRPPSAQLSGKIYVRSTLIVVPPHLTRQWGSEVNKFTGDLFTVVIVSTASSLNSLTIKDVQEADIVIVASNLFHSSVYLANLEAFAAGGTLPSQDGRFFNARLDHILGSLRDQVEQLRTNGSEAVMQAILDARKKDNEADVFVQKRRVKGAKARVPAEIESGSRPNDSMYVDEEHPRIPPPSNKIVEVVIPVHRSPSTVARSYSSDAEVSAPPASEATSAVESSDVDSTTRRLRKCTGRISLIDSDSDEVDVRPKGLSTTKASAKSTSSLRFKKPIKRKAESSDYEDSLSESEEKRDESDGVNEHTDFGHAKKLVKRPSKPSRLLKRAKTSTEITRDMVNGGPLKAVSIASKTASAKIKQVKPMKLREESDPWKLKTKAKNDWEQMHSPPLEIFHFARIVIDEYTYLEGKILSMVQRLTATRRWVLSGTPPIHDFASLKTIAAFLNVHLGVDDDGEGQSASVKKRQREQTDSEKFHSFREVHTNEWHAHRHQLGQKFLDQFVRQNIAEIDEISWVEKIELVNLPAAERAIYLELEHHLRALDMTIKRGRKSESDREKRLAQSLGESSSAEEALLKRCSHFDLDVNEENAMKACEVIVRERTKQLEDCKRELVDKLQHALALQSEIGKTDSETYFQEYVRVTHNEGVGDKDATSIALEQLKMAGIEGPLSCPSNKSADSRKNVKDKGKAKGVSNGISDLIWDIREQTHEIRRLTKELVGRVRSLRYFTVVRDLQKQSGIPSTASCPSCANQKIPIEDIAVLSSCGHIGCIKCVMSCAEREECVCAQSGGCNAAARVLNIVKGDTLGVDDVARDGTGKHFGVKLEKIVELIQKRIPNQERVLVFVQFPDLMKKVAAAFSANKIKFLEIKGSASQKSKNLEKFQNDSEERVLLLNVTDESASGANLTGANHAIFVNPLLTSTQEIYEACETQAIGRVRRYGQTKLVHIWRFLSLGTIDVEIFEQRTKKKLL
ncbi:uncharacterized protein FOMMEDRAFT_102039 [Fomitiporia mediterranea MF3/22]|uniref:uncharacterized protein n=1 Tax=Fomitiporia mediterranea (strain MF3/22) TaxID=694068 RepID=UPI000440905B|nr:uncharacterized protein FOMMEDRAFT_102039 [Fomitiporia mediterranea MF3/22]EJD08575.1 hypothetical protein FOMMEDRAFT_102039 [Fomitiporia mediterranea MF3/22]